MNKIKIKLFGFKIFDEVPKIDIKLNNSILESNVEISNSGTELIYNIEKFNNCNNLEIEVTNKIFENSNIDDIYSFRILDVESAKEDPYDLFVFLLSLDISHDNGLTWIDMMPCMSKNNPQGSFMLKKDKNFCWDKSQLKLFGDNLTEDKFDDLFKLNIFFSENSIINDLIYLTEPIMGIHYSLCINSYKKILFPKNSDFISIKTFDDKGSCISKDKNSSIIVSWTRNNYDIPYFLVILDFDKVTTLTNEGKITLLRLDD